MKFDKIDDFYANAYDQVYQTGLVGDAWAKIFDLMQKKASPNRNVSGNEVILEVGAGQGYFVKNYKSKFRLYIETDIRGRNKSDTNLKLDDLKHEGAIFRICDAQDLSVIPNDTFDLVYATCLLIHLPFYETALHEWSRVLKTNGKLIIYVPCEPGILLRFVRFFSTKRKLASIGFSHNVIHWSEHRNHFIGMKTALSETFAPSLKEFKWPFKLLGWNFNLFSIFVYQKPNNDI
jgi:ubiquinone/menaquinone biosynthesis C-methylase UbiE